MKCDQTGAPTSRKLSLRLVAAAPGSDFVLQTLQFLERDQTFVQSPMTLYW